MRLPSNRGFTIIELMIGLVVFALLLVLGAPSFFAYFQNSHIRNSAESIQNGLLMARAEAVRRNKVVSFQLVDSLTASCTISTSGANWIVSQSNPTSLCDQAPSETAAPLAIQKRSANQGSERAVVAAAQATISFNGLGRATNLGASPTNINVSNPTGGACASASGPMRCLRVDVTNAGQVRVCDPALASTDTRAC
ncbi:MAG: GspH/FimT family pseudopilin [Betaproteobacteria bacterium]